MEKNEKTDDIQPTVQQENIEEAAETTETPAPVHKTIDPALDDDYHINLSWRSWVVVFVTCFA